MKQRHVLRTLASILILNGVLFTAPADASTRARVYVRVGPPAPIVNAVVVTPGPRYVWTPGFYRWSGRAYVWVPGRYVLPPRPRSVWIPGRWTHNRGGWFWIDGRWH
jgi:hypothetical protein